jgi:hypothetical protein
MPIDAGPDRERNTAHGRIDNALARRTLHRTGTVTR